MSEREEEFRNSQQVETTESTKMEQRSKDWRERFYKEYPYKEIRSTGEWVGENSFYNPHYEEDPNLYYGYPATDFFGLTTKEIVPLSDSEYNAVNYGESKISDQEDKGFKPGD